MPTPEINQLFRELTAICAARGIRLRVVNAANLELRMYPFSITLGTKAVFHFAKLEIGKCALTTGAIIETYDSLLRTFASGFDAKRFFDQCLAAYLTTLAGEPAGTRVELKRFIPTLTSALGRGYTKARFAFDVWNLQQAGGMTKGGLRMNLGTATGDSAYDKSRVIYFEDGSGAGEYRLTIFFTRI